uniref:Transmembrane protein n=1 Tax=Parastrongyloides trichosuri TaxID=131310 RepID=A0A0N4ZZA4_PARTI
MGFKITSLVAFIISTIFLISGFTFFIIGSVKPNDSLFSGVNNKNIDHRKYNDLNYIVDVDNILHINRAYGAKLTIGKVETIVGRLRLLPSCQYTKQLASQMIKDGQKFKEDVEIKFEILSDPTKKSQMVDLCTKTKMGKMASTGLCILLTLMCIIHLGTAGLTFGSIFGFFKLRNIQLYIACLGGLNFVISIVNFIFSIYGNLFAYTLRGLENNEIAKIYKLPEIRLFLTPLLSSLSLAVGNMIFLVIAIVACRQRARNIRNESISCSQNSLDTSVKPYNNSTKGTKSSGTSKNSSTTSKIRSTRNTTSVKTKSKPPTSSKISTRGSSKN